MRLNQNEEDLFNEIENIEFDFSLDDDIKKLKKKEKEKVLDEIKNFVKDIKEIKSEEKNYNERNKNK